MQKGPAPAVQATFAAALRQHQAGRLQEAERLYLEVLKAVPRHADALHFRGVLAHQTGRNELALELIDKAITQNARIPAFHHNRGTVLSELGEHARAAGAYRQAITLNPTFTEAHYSLGVALQALGQWDAAASSYLRTAALKPDYAEPQVNLGMIFSEQGRLEEAASHFERALALDPNHAVAHNGLGNVRKQQGRLDQATASYECAAVAAPEFVEAQVNLGIVLLERGDAEAALTHFERALAQRADYVPALRHLAHALLDLGRGPEAQAAYRRALALNPNDANARLGIALAAIPVAPQTPSESSGAIDAFARALDELSAWVDSEPRRLGAAVGSNLPFYLAYRPRNVGALIGRFGDLMCSAAPAQWSRAAAIASVARPVRQRIRLAIVSGHVCRHPVWDIVLRGILAHLDRSRIDIILYHTAAAVDDEPAWARQRCDRFVQGPKSVEAWLSEIERDLPDVIFYPEVGMDAATCALASLRLARLQVAGWGHPVTTGLPTIDQFVSGDLLEGVTAERDYREKLVRLPGTGVCTEIAGERAETWAGPAKSPQIVRFALCQQPIKFDPADDLLIGRIAKAAGPSEFWLAAPEKRSWTAARLYERLVAVFRAAGLDPAAHLRVMPWLPPMQFLGFLDAMDLYLDCPAFSGYTTARQAVHRGLPIVTLEGGYLRQRLAAGVLRQLELPQGIVASRDEYLSLAARWAGECRSQPEAWLQRRALLRKAAYKIDGNIAAVSAFERLILAPRVTDLENSVLRS